MRSTTIVLTVCLLPLTALLAAGCESQPQAQPAALGRPLYFDPTEKYSLGEWWSNGELLLRIRPNAAYEIYAENNRYREPIERGRWTQRNYAALEFEPYERAGSPVERVVIDKVGPGDYVLLLRNLKPFASIAAPPEVLEDQLLGQWVSDEHAIMLRRDGGYRYDRRGSIPPGQAALAGHEGTWEVRGDTLTLQPAAAGLAPLTFKIVTQDNVLSPEGMRRP